MSNRLLSSLVGPAAQGIRWYLELVWRTSRLRSGGLDPEALLRGPQAPFVVTFWHARLGWPVWAYRGPSFAGVLSGHRDGELLARCLSALGTRSVRGSSLSGGEEALRGAVRLLRQGVTCALAPDGPVGPPGRARPGAVALASAAGAPLLPIAWSGRPCLRLPSWDGLLVPLPGCRGAYVVGEPIAVPPRLLPAELEPWRAELERRLAEVTARADVLAGRSGPAQKKAGTRSPEAEGAAERPLQGGEGPSGSG